MKIYLIRHGKTYANARMEYCGFSDSMLSEEGIDQLKKKASTLRYPNVEGLDIYTSGLTRTEQTLFYLFGEQKHAVLPNFKEMNFGDFEAKNYEELKDDERFIQWCSGDNVSNVPPNGESGMQMAERAIAEFERLIEKGRDCLVVSHGGPIASIALYYFPDDGDNWYVFQPDNGEGYEFTIENNKVVSYKKIPEIK